MTQDHLLEAARKLRRGLPRQGPGSEASTGRLLERALASRPEDAAPVRTILDLGAGPGPASLLLAERTDADVVAVDIDRMLLDELEERAAARGLTGRIRTEQRSMEDLSFLDAPADLIWCEAAVSAVGLEEALRAWAPHLAENGRIVLTEIEWIAEPSAEVAKHWLARRPLRNHERNAKLCAQAGFDVVHHEILPDSDWWDEHYGLLAERIQAAGRGDPAVVEVARTLQREMAIRQDYGDEYALAGYVLAPR